MSGTSDKKMERTDLIPVAWRGQELNPWCWLQFVTISAPNYYCFFIL